MFCHCICIKANGHYQHHCRALHHTSVSTCWWYSLASDWVRFSKSNRLSDNVWQSSGGMVSFCCLDIDVLPLYMYMKGQWTLSAPLYGPPSRFCVHLLAVLLPQIGSDFRNRIGCPTMYHLNVEVYNHSPSYILVIPLCNCILKANGHYQHHCRALHHTSVASCWRF